jgi:hypothetical protein
MTAVGTGFNTVIGNADFGLSSGTFVGGFVHNDTSISIETYVQAICASGAGYGGGAAPSVPSAATATHDFAADVANARRQSD